MQKAIYPDYKSYGIWKEKIPVPKVQKQQSEAADYVLWDHNLQKELEAGVENLHSQASDHFQFLTDNSQKKAWQLNLVIVGIIRATGIFIVSLVLLLLVGSLELPGLMMP